VIERTAGRVILTDPEDRVLMVRGVDPADRARGGFWFTPGGGLEPGESLEAGTRREIREELGVELGTLGPVVMIRRVRFPMHGRWYEQTESLFHVAVPAVFTPRPVALDELELTAIEEFRWLSADELRALDEPYHPAALVELLDHLRRHGPPDPAWVDDQVRPAADGGE
jgi:8-oxo-dGTP pyrophosphatase MutT (NUDIX family)